MTEYEAQRLTPGDLLICIDSTCPTLKNKIASVGSRVLYESHGGYRYLDICWEDLNLRCSNGGYYPSRFKSLKELIADQD